MNLQETQRIKDAVEQNPQDFEKIIESTKIGVCVTNEDGIYVGMNEAYLNILSYQRNEMLGKSFMMVVPTEKQKELQQLHDDFIAIQIEMFDKFSIIDKFGKLVYIDVDAGFSDKIHGAAHKLTFVQKATADK
jgi:PAS domain S-box-containing protein